MGDVIKPKAPWQEKPGVEDKLDINEADALTLFDDFDEKTVEFNGDDIGKDMVFDYTAARKNAHFCVHASKKILNMIAGNLLFSRDPLIADSCVKLVKVISENNRDLIKIHKDFKSTQQIGKPKPGEKDEETPISPEEKKSKIKATVSEIVAAQKEEMEDKNGQDD